MYQLYRTDDMEGTAHALAARYGTLLIRAAYNNIHKIRMQPKKIADLQAYIHPSPGDSQLKMWKAAGHGTLMWRQVWKLAEQIPPHQAQLVVEAPPSMLTMHRYTKATQDVVVVYCPPNWNHHLDTVRVRFPTSVLCQRLVDLVRHEGPALSDELACAQLEVDVYTLMRMRRALKCRCTTYYRLIERVPPESKALAETYRLICSVPAVDGIRPVSRDSLTFRQKNQMLALVVCGSIGRKDTITVYHEWTPAWDKIDANRLLQLDNLKEVIDLVEAAPKLVVDALPQTQSLAHEPTLSAAPLGDTRH